MLSSLYNNTLKLHPETETLSKFIIRAYHVNNQQISLTFIQFIHLMFKNKTDNIGRYSVTNLGCIVVYFLVPVVNITLAM